MAPRRESRFPVRAPVLRVAWGACVTLLRRISEGGFEAAQTRVAPTKVALEGDGKAADRDGDTAAASDAAHPELPAFEAFFREHQQAIFTYLYRMTGNEQTAYDLSQEVFVRAWQRYERLRGYVRPVAWLFRVATNLALNDRRARVSPIRSTVSFDVSGDPATSDPAWRLSEQIANRDAIREALLRLIPRQRAALVLREVYGLTGEEVAAALRISHAAAKMLLSRAREQFRACYQGEEWVR